MRDAIEMGPWSARHESERAEMTPLDTVTVAVSDIRETSVEIECVAEPPIRIPPAWRQASPSVAEPPTWLTQVHVRLPDGSCRIVQAHEVQTGWVIVPPPWA